MPTNEDMHALLDLVVCPTCRDTLVDDRHGLRCAQRGHTFAVRENVPVLLTHGGDLGEGSRLARLHYALLGNPRVYEFHQRHGGGRSIAARVGAALRDAGGSTLVDVGAGTGMVAALVPGDMRYVWLDNDSLKLRGFLSKSVDAFAVLGDAVQLPFADRAADWTVMVEVSHHLPDDALRRCLGEIARVTRERFLFVDALRGSRVRSNVMWKLDLGRFPRGEGELLGALDESFEVERIERFRVNHDHLLCVCTPRTHSPRHDP